MRSREASFQKAYVFSHRPLALLPSVFASPSPPLPFFSPNVFPKPPPRSHSRTPARRAYLSTPGLSSATQPTSTLRRNSSQSDGSRVHPRAKRAISSNGACHFRTGREDAWEGSESCHPFYPQTLYFPTRLISPRMMESVSG